MRWEQRAALVAAAQGHGSPDLLLQGGQVVNVYSGEVLAANVAVLGERICYVGPEAPAGPHTQVVDCRGRFLCPGFVEPHTHPWVVYGPGALAAYGAARGTTAFACDNLVFWLRLGPAGFRRLADECRALPARFYWWLRVMGNAQGPDEADTFGPEVLAALQWPDVVGLAEMTAWVRIARGEPRLLQAMDAALALHKRVDGHTAGASYRRLGALAAAGLSACHEAITGAEALDRLRLGYWTTLRFQSLRPDLPDLAAAVVRAGVDTRRLLLTQDAGSPPFVWEHGLMDACVRIGIAAGMPPVQAIQLATINPATYLGLDADLGGIAPGRLADIQVLPDLVSFRPEQVYLSGRRVAAGGAVQVPVPPTPSLGAWPGPPPAAVVGRPDLYPTPWAAGPVPVIQFESTAITRRVDTNLPVTAGRIGLDARPDLCYAALVGEGARWISRGVVGGLVTGLEGLATTALGGGGLLVLGRSPAAMALAARTAAAGGGTVLVSGGQVACHLKLPLLGFMSDRPMAELAAAYTELTDRLRALGYTLGDPGYSLDFLCGDFLPDLRLTPRGLVDVKSGQVLVPPAAL